MPPLNVFGIGSHTLQIEHVAKFPLGPWQLRPVAIQALCLENLVHLRSHFRPFGGVLGSPHEAGHCQEEDTQGNTKLHRLQG